MNGIIIINIMNQSLFEKNLQIKFRYMNSNKKLIQFLTCYNQNANDSSFPTLQSDWRTKTRSGVHLLLASFHN